MKLLPLYALALLLTACGLSGSSKPALLGAAQNYEATLVRLLEDRGTVVPQPLGLGQAGNTHTQETSYQIDASVLDDEGVAAVAHAAMEEWGQIETYRTWGKGGGGARYALHFGDRGSHAFVDVVARSTGSWTEVLVLLRVQD